MTAARVEQVAREMTAAEGWRDPDRTVCLRQSRRAAYWGGPTECLEEGPLWKLKLPEARDFVAGEQSGNGS